MSTMRPGSVFGGGAGIQIFSDAQNSENTGQTQAENARARTQAKSMGGAPKRRFGAQIDPNALGSRTSSTTNTTKQQAPTRALPSKGKAAVKRVVKGVHGADKIAALRGEWEVESCQSGISVEGWEKATEFSDPLLDDLDGFLAGVAKAQKVQKAKASMPRFGKENGGGISVFEDTDLASDALFAFPVAAPTAAATEFALSESDLDDW